MLDPSSVTQEKGLMGGEGVTPEHVLMAAATMHDMGRLVEPSGASGLKMPHVTRGSGTGRIKRRATGGPVEEGEPYLVGEQGPEVIVPKQKGTVLASADIDPTKQQSPFGLPKETGSGGGSRTIEETLEKGIAKVLGENLKSSGNKSIDAITEKAVKNLYSISDEFAAKHASTSVKPMSREEWMSLKNEFSSPTSIPARAQEGGFNPDMPMYKGGYAKGTGPIGPTGGRTQLKDPSGKTSERGQFFAEDPEIAREYGSDVNQYVAAPKKPAVIDLKGKEYDRATMHEIIEDARSKGHDMVIVRNMRDVGPGGAKGLMPEQNQIVVTDPSIVRSPSAKFDPEKFHLNDLLAGIVGAFGVGAAAKGRKKDEQ
jgi:hypothetical protein